MFRATKIDSCGFVQNTPQQVVWSAISSSSGKKLLGTGSVLPKYHMGRTSGTAARGKERGQK
jgi:hypothetical protein